MEEIAVFWFRRDLRIDDNLGLYQALKSGFKVLPVYIFDPEIWSRYTDVDNRQLHFIRNAVYQLKQELIDLNSDLLVFEDLPPVVFQNLINEYNVKMVFANEEFDPFSIQRDRKISEFLNSNGITLNLFTDHLIHKPGVILKPDRSPYTIFTPFSKQWKLALKDQNLVPFPVTSLISNLYTPKKVSNFKKLKTQQTILSPINREIPTEIIQTYDATRDFPAIHNGTSQLGVHLRFGTISIRKLVSIALQLNIQFLNELIWREFFMHILFHFPYVIDGAFKSKYNNIHWQNNELEFENWCLGNTGVPIVDAGMRQLIQTGFMHNRVRMIVASYLVKHLLIDWRWGEAYFAQKLIDYELSANNGNWQWVAGTGCDAAPYFRIFNPFRQQERFDPTFEFVKLWVPEYQTEEYKKRFVTDLKKAAERCINVYKTSI